MSPNNSSTKKGGPYRIISITKKGIERINTQNKRIQAEIDHLDKKIAHMRELADRDEITSEHYEDLDNWTGWRDALSWVLKGCKGNPHQGDGY